MSGGVFGTYVRADNVVSKTKELTAILDGETSQHSHLESGTVPS